MSAARSSYINLYASDDLAEDNYKAQMSCDSADVEFAGPQDLMFDFNAYQFKKADSSVFDLETRFQSLESDQVPANNTAAIAAVAADLAAETVARQSADTSNGNLITAETAARTSSVQAVQTALDTQEAKQVADDAARAADIAAEASARATAISAEETRALAAEASLQSQITNILSNSDASVIDSVAELLSHVNAEDATLLGQIAALQTDFAALLARVDALTAQ